MLNCSYCSINDAYNGIPLQSYNGISDDKIKEKDNSTNETKLNEMKFVENQWEDVPFFSANGKFVNSKNKEIDKPIIEHFESDKCTHLMTCPFCRKNYNTTIKKYNNQQKIYKKVIVYFLISLIMIMLFDLFD